MALIKVTTGNVTYFRKQDGCRIISCSCGHRDVIGEISGSHKHQDKIRLRLKSQPCKNCFDGTGKPLTAEMVDAFFRGEQRGGNHE